MFAQKAESALIASPTGRPASAEEAKQCLLARAEEARRRALEYDGDPIEDLRQNMPDDFPAELWQKIIDGEYD